MFHPSGGLVLPKSPGLTLGHPGDTSGYELGSLSFVIPKMPSGPPRMTYPGWKVMYASIQEPPLPPASRGLSAAGTNTTPSVNSLPFLIG